MGIRNFWVEGHVDGRRTTISGGPQGREGGIDLVIGIREGGTISTKKLHITGHCIAEKWLRLDAWIEGVEGPERLTIETLR